MLVSGSTPWTPERLSNGYSGNLPSEGYFCHQAARTNTLLVFFRAFMRGFLFDPEIRWFVCVDWYSKGQPFNPDARMTRILTDAVAVANATAQDDPVRQPRRASKILTRIGSGSPLSLAVAISSRTALSVCSMLPNIDDLIHTPFVAKPCPSQLVIARVRAALASSHPRSIGS